MHPHVQFSEDAYTDAYTAYTAYADRDRRQYMHGAEYCLLYFLQVCFFPREY